MAGTLSGVIQATLPQPDNLTLLLNTERAQAATVEARQSAFDAALRIENSTRHSPETVDCASCHVAMGVRRSAVQVFGLDEQGNPNAFQLGDFPAIALPPLVDLENIHAFSYLGAELGVSQRTANAPPTHRQRTANAPPTKPTQSSCASTSFSSERGWQEQCERGAPFARRA